MPRLSVFRFEHCCSDLRGGHLAALLGVRLAPVVEVVEAGSPPGVRRDAGERHRQGASGGGAGSSDMPAGGEAAAGGVAAGVAGDAHAGGGDASGSPDVASASSASSGGGFAWSAETRALAAAADACDPDVPVTRAVVRCLAAKQAVEGTGVQLRWVDAAPAWAAWLPRGGGGGGGNAAS